MVRSFFGCQTKNFPVYYLQKGTRPFSTVCRKNAMMKKAGAGWFLFVAGAFLSGGWFSGGGGLAFAQESTGAPAAATANEPAPTSPFLEANQKAAARADGIKDQSLEEWKALLKQTEEALPALGQAATARNNELREARIAADREAPEIKALYKQIEELQGRIAAVTDTLPGVKEKLDAYSQAQSALFEEMQFRTKLMGLIRQRENADSPTSAKEIAP